MDGYSGLGHSLVERLLEYIFSMEEFKVDPDYGKTTLENRLPQMFQKIHLKSDSANGKWDKKLALDVRQNNVKQTKEHYAGIEYSMKITKMYVDRINDLENSMAEQLRNKYSDYQHPRVPELLGIYKQEKMERQKSLYKWPLKLFFIAYNTLKEYGFDTLEFALMGSEMWSRSDDSLGNISTKRSLYIQAIRHAQLNGYDYIYLRECNNSKSAKILGVKLNDRENATVLFFGDGEDKHDAYEKTLFKFVESFGGLVEAGQIQQQAQREQQMQLQAQREQEQREQQQMQQQREQEQQMQQQWQGQQQQMQPQSGYRQPGYGQSHVDESRLAASSGSGQQPGYGQPPGYGPQPGY